MEKIVINGKTYTLDTDRAMALGVLKNQTRPVKFTDVAIGQVFRYRPTGENVSMLYLKTSTTDGARLASTVVKGVWAARTNMESTDKGCMFTESYKMGDVAILTASGDYQTEIAL